MNKNSAEWFALDFLARKYGVSAGFTQKQIGTALVNSNDSRKYGFITVQDFHAALQYLLEKKYIKDDGRDKNFIGIPGVEVPANTYTATLKGYQFWKNHKNENKFSTLAKEGIMIFTDFFSWSKFKKFYIIVAAIAATLFILRFFELL